MRASLGVMALALSVSACAARSSEPTLPGPPPATAVEPETQPEPVSVWGPLQLLAEVYFDVAGRAHRAALDLDADPGSGPPTARCVHRAREELRHVAAAVNRLQGDAAVLGEAFLQDLRFVRESLASVLSDDASSGDPEIDYELYLDEVFQTFESLHRLLSALALDADDTPLGSVARCLQARATVSREAASIARHVRGEFYAVFIWEGQAHAEWEAEQRDAIDRVRDTAGYIRETVADPPVDATDAESLASEVESLTDLQEYLAPTAIEAVREAARQLRAATTATSRLERAQRLATALDHLAAATLPSPPGGQESETLARIQDLLEALAEAQVRGNAAVLAAWTALHPVGGDYVEDLITTVADAQEACE